MYLEDWNSKKKKKKKKKKFVASFEQSEFCKPSSGHLRIIIKQDVLFHSVQILNFLTPK